MELKLTVLGIISGLELLLWVGPLWRLRRILAAVLLLLLSVITGLIVGSEFQFWSMLLLVLSLYRIINLLRLVEGRMQVDYLYRATLRTSLWLIGLQAAVLAGAGVSAHCHMTNMGWWYLLAAAQLALAVLLLSSTLRHIRKTTPPLPHGTYAERDLPALTVAIPARNETEDLEACLESLLKSTYPKLEILVLDDCSQNKRTPEIIRNFAHAGVRFIAGKVPPDQWLAKNYAYAQLTEEANGQLLLFCGVDTRFEPGSLTALVELLLQKKKTMISILPRNMPAPRLSALTSLLIQPNRYVWELAPPRRLLQRPPVLSTCWLITAEALHAAGGFKAVSHKAIAESYLARQTARKNDGYSFLQSDARIGITSEKSLDEQRVTAIRTRYPQLHRRPEMVALISSAEFATLVWPLIILIVALVSQLWLLAALTSLAFILASILYAKVVNLTYRAFIGCGLFVLPIAVLYDICLLNYSMWQYEFREVIWKGRNVCIPIMRTSVSLPKID